MIDKSAATLRRQVLDELRQSIIAGRLAPVARLVERADDSQEEKLERVLDAVAEAYEKGDPAVILETKNRYTTSYWTALVAKRFPR